MKNSGDRKNREEKKLAYEAPEVEIIRFSTEDVITASGIRLPEDEFNRKYSRRQRK